MELMWFLGGILIGFITGVITVKMGLD